MVRRKGDKKSVSSNEHAIESGSAEAMSYCNDKKCRGIKPTFECPEGGDETECPICFESMNLKSVTKLDKCRHLFCEDCVKGCPIEKGCPMCRQTYGRYVTINRFIKCDEDWQTLFEMHRCCSFYFNDTVKGLVQGLNGNWEKLLSFFFRSETKGDAYLGIRGIDHLCLDEGYCDKVTKRGHCYAVVKKGEETHLVMGILLPFVSMRLVISPNDSSKDIQQDDEYADEVIGYIAHQLEVCWRAFQSLIDRTHIDHIIIRKFETKTCSLLISGFQDFGPTPNHKIPMKEQLQNVKKCNFEDSFFKTVRLSFPPCSRVNLETPLGYDETICCK